MTTSLIHSRRDREVLSGSERLCTARIKLLRSGANKRLGRRGICSGSHRASRGVLPKRNGDGTVGGSECSRCYCCCCCRRRRCCCCRCGIRVGVGDNGSGGNDGGPRLSTGSAELPKVNFPRVMRLSYNRIFFPRYGALPTYRAGLFRGRILQRSYSTSDMGTPV